MVVFGRRDASLAIDLFTSLACSDCKDFHEQAFGMLMSEYARPGKICLTSREYFRSDRPLALEAAKVATAAARIGLYEPVVDVLFSSQPIWTAKGNLWETVCGVLHPQQQVAVQDLLKNADIIEEINRDIEDAKVAGVHGTPILYIKSGDKKTPFVGVPELRMFRRFLDGIIGG